MGRGEWARQDPSKTHWFSHMKILMALHIERIAVEGEHPKGKHGCVTYIQPGSGPGGGSPTGNE